MAHRLFISATNTDVGKTYTTLCLIRHLSALGYRVGVFKPIETGVIETPMDGNILYHEACIHLPALGPLGVDSVVPYRFALPAAPYAASGGMCFDLNQIEAKMAKIEALCDILLIEGAGGLLVPIDARYSMLDLAHHLRAHVLLIVHTRLGCINDALLNHALLAHTPHHLLFNPRPEEVALFEHISEPYLEHVLGDVYRLDRDLPRLVKTILDTIASHPTKE